MRENEEWAGGFTWGVLRLEKYGVPQTRRRLVLMSGDGLDRLREMEQPIVTPADVLPILAKRARKNEVMAIKRSRACRRVVYLFIGRLSKSKYLALRDRPPALPGELWPLW